MPTLCRLFVAPRPPAAISAISSGTTERDYWQGMYRYPQRRIARPVAGERHATRLQPAHVQAGLDYLDTHAYWQHPTFPGRPWDIKNWYVERHRAGEQSRRQPRPSGSRCRVAGKPYTVSEYNHPAPNSYAAEGFPMIAAFGAFQRWDGIYSFAYSHNREFEPRRIEGFFDIKSNTAQLAHMPACAAMFLRGDVAPASRPAMLPPSARGRTPQAPRDAQLPGGSRPMNSPAIALHRSSTGRRST